MPPVCAECAQPVLNRAATEPGHPDGAMSIREDATTLLLRLARLEKIDPNLRNEYIEGPDLDKLLQVGPSGSVTPWRCLRKMATPKSSKRLGRHRTISTPCN